MRQKAARKKEESKQAALELLNKVWASYTDDEKFPAAGGDYDNSVDDAAGAVNIANAENLSYLFTFPASDAVKLDGAASLMHMMNGNTFTCGAFHAANAEDVSSIVEDIHAEISGKHWMCGFPDKMLIATSGNLIVSVYGDEELVNTFRDKLLARSIPVSRPSTTRRSARKSISNRQEASMLFSSIPFLYYFCRWCWQSIFLVPRGLKNAGAVCIEPPVLRLGRAKVLPVYAAEHLAGVSLRAVDRKKR